MSYEAIIKIERLNKSHKLDDDKSIEVLKNVNLEIDSNDSCVIHRSFGSGKSTLFHRMVGFIVGWYLSHRAVKTDPLDALRYE